MQIQLSMHKSGKTKNILSSSPLHVSLGKVFPVAGDKTERKLFSLPAFLPLSVCFGCQFVQRRMERQKNQVSSSSGSSSAKEKKVFKTFPLYIANCSGQLFALTRFKSSCHYFTLPMTRRRRLEVTWNFFVDVKKLFSRSKYFSLGDKHWENWHHFFPSFVCMHSMRPGPGCHFSIRSLAFSAQKLYNSSSPAARKHKRTNDIFVKWNANFPSFFQARHERYKSGPFLVYSLMANQSKQQARGTNKQTSQAYWRIDIFPGQPPPPPKKNKKKKTANLKVCIHSTGGCEPCMLPTRHEPNETAIKAVAFVSW